MATIGTVAAFDEKTQSWEEYCEILDNFFEANDIDNAEKQRAILLSVVGSKIYSLIQNLLSPDKPKSKSYAQLVYLLKKHFNPKPSEIVQRFKFDSRSRRPDETVTDFVAELRKLVQDCNYGETLQQMLRDRLVCGVNDERIQRRLLSEQNLTFDTALKIALSLEAADKNAQDLRNNNAAAACHKVCSKADGRVSCDEGMQASAASKSCFRCKGTNHSAPDCRFKTAKCHSCGKIGHISRACRSKGKTASRERERDSRDKKGSGHRAYKVEGSDSDDSVDTFTLGCIKEYIRKVNSKNLTKVQPYTVDMQIDGHKVKLEIDTGCSLTVLNKETFKELRKSGKSTKIKQTGIKLETYTGQPIEVKGTSQVTVEYQEQKKTLPVVVVAGNGPNLLGRGWLAELKLSWDQIKHERHVLQIQTGDDSLQKMLVRHSDVFKEELGTLRGLQAKCTFLQRQCLDFFAPDQCPMQCVQKWMMS